MKTIYLDHSATTPVSEGALAAYCDASRLTFGNPSSLHAVGKAAEDLLTESRTTVRGALGATDGTLVFTSGGTEANNLALFGRAYAKERYRTGKTILTTAGEHASVERPLAALATAGYRVITLPTRGGVIDMEAAAAAMNEQVILVSAMLVNNETGALYNIASLSACMKRLAPEAILHCDATQGFLRTETSPRRLGADLITVSAHKIGGPKGIGALWVSPAVLKNRGLTPYLLGGGQESGLRSGTENVPAAAAMAEACREGVRDRAARMEHLRALEEHLLSLLQQIPQIRCNRAPVSVPHIFSITLPDIKSETMLHFLSSRGISVSSGSACSSHGRHGATPLAAFGLSDREADCTIRVSLSHTNTAGDLDALAEGLRAGLDSLVRMRP